MLEVKYIKCSFNQPITGLRIKKLNGGEGVWIQTSHSNNVYTVKLSYVMPGTGYFMLS